MTLVYNGSNWVQATTPTSQLLVTSSGSSAYLFTGAGFPSTSGNNPTLTLKRGQTYYFVNNSGGSHPFRIQSTTGTGGTAYNTGVTNNGASSGAIVFHVPMDAPNTLYYQCTSHGGMVGTIKIVSGVSFSTDKSNTGDGSATTITILANRTVDDVLVFVNGICLVPTDDYSISGTTLTFTTAPANTAEIVVRYLG